MSTLGGTRGERNAKPKFAALDINKLYITSRGESLEPSSQKSAVPRKHGMQSLGKVPTARRPPANLPSLKAEVGNPVEQSGTWTSDHNEGQNLIKNSSDSTEKITASSNPSISSSSTLHQSSSLNNPQTCESSWNTNEFPSLDGSGSYGGNINSKSQIFQDHYPGASQPTLRHPNDAVSRIQLKGPSGRGTLSHIATEDADGGGGGNNLGGSNNCQGTTTSSHSPPLPPQFRALLPPFMQRGSDCSLTGNENEGGTSSLPVVSSVSHLSISGMVNDSRNNNIVLSANNNSKNLDNSKTSNNSNSNSSSSSSSSGSKNNNHNEGTGNSGSNFSPANVATNVMKMSNQFPLKQPSGLVIHSLQQQNARIGGGNNYSSMPTAKGGRVIRGVGGPNSNTGREGSTERASGSAYNDNYQHIIRRGGINHQPRYSNRNTTGVSIGSYNSSVGHVRSSGSGNVAVSGDAGSPSGFHDDNRNSHPPYGSGALAEQEVVVRPIIRDEELQRLEAIAKDEGWAKDYEFDYNQKLEFSDDESELNPSTTGIKEKDTTMGASEKNSMGVRDEKVTADTAKFDKHDRTQEHVGVALRDLSHDQEGNSIQPNGNSGVRGIGGEGGVINVNIVAGGLDAAEAKERIKQRREEDQRREIERKQAAARKLQELEEKLSRKKNDDAFDVKTGNNDKNISGGINVSISSTGNANPLPGNRMEEEKTVESVGEQCSERIISVKIRGKSGERANAKEIRYEFGSGGARHDREGGILSGSTSGSANWDTPGFSKTFQSNLPPRFQKRKFERNTSGTNLSTTNSNTTSNQTSSRNTNSFSCGSTGSSVTNSGSETKSTIPFAQQYDPRYIHNQQTYGRSAAPNAMSSLRRIGTTANVPVRDREERQRQLYDMREHSQREVGKEKVESTEDNNRFTVVFGEASESSANNHAKHNTGGRVTPQLVRSLSESSNRKTSVSSDENHQNVGHHPHHASSSSYNPGNIATMSGNYVREMSWDTEAEKGSSPSSPASFSGSERPSRPDCEQPKQILQRVKEVTSQIADAMKEDKISSKRIMKIVDCESNYKKDGIERCEHTSSDNVACNDSNANISNVTTDPDGNVVDIAAEKVSKVLKSEESSTFGVADTNTKENIESCPNECSKDSTHLDSHQSRSMSGTDDKKLVTSTATGGVSSQQHVGKKKSMTLMHQQHSRDNRRHDTRGGSRGGSYSGGFHRADVTTGSSLRGGTGSWNRSRGGSRMEGSRSYNQDYWSESEFSEEGFDEQSKVHLHQKIYNQSMIASAAVQSAIGTDTAGAATKEGFVPRGEPSRRGRGGGNAGSNVSVTSSSNTNNRQKQQQTPFSGGASSMEGTGSISKKMEGYGPPNSKSPFGGSTGNSEDRNTKHWIGDSFNSNIGAASPTRDDRVVQKNVRPLSFSDGNKATEDVSTIDQEKICSILGEGKSGAIEVCSDESHSREENLVSQKSSTRSSVSDSRIGMETNDTCDTNKSGTMTDDTKTKTKGSITSIATKNGSSIASQQQSKTGTTQAGTINSGNNSSLDFALQGNASVAHIGNNRGGPQKYLVMRKQQPVSRGQGAKALTTDTATDISSGSGSNANQTVSTVININSSGNKGAGTLAAHTSTISTEIEKACHPQQQQSATDKLSASSPVNAKTDNDKHNLDGNTPPVNTIIFENTNYKSGVSVLSGSSTSPVVGDCGGVGGDTTITGLRRQHSSSNVTNFGSKVNTGLINEKVTAGAACIAGALINPQQTMASNSSAHRPITTTTSTAANEGGMQHNIVGSSQRTVHSTGVSKQQPCNMITSSLQGIPFQKNENDYKDIKSYAFETDISHLIDGDKGIKPQSSVSAGLCLSKSIEAEGGGSSHGGVAVSVKNIISPSTADLNMKIASVKKVWEMPTVPEQTATVVNTGSGSSANRGTVGNEHSVSGGGNVASGNNVHLKSSYVRGPHQPSHQSQYQHSHPGGTSHHTHQTHGTHSSYGAAFGAESDSLVDHFNNSNSVCNVSGSAGSNSGCDRNSAITLNNDCSDSANGGYNLSHHHSQQQPAKSHQQTRPQQLQQQHHQQELQHQRQPPHNMQESSSQQSSQQHTQQPQKQLQQHQSPHALQQHSQQLQRQQQHKEQSQHLQQFQQLHQQSQSQHKPPTQSQSQPQQSQSLPQSQTQSASQSQPQSQTQTSQPQAQLQTQTQPQLKAQQQTQQLAQQLPQQLSQAQSQQHPHQHQQQHPSHKQLQQTHHQQSLQLQHQQQTQQQSQHVTAVGVQQHQAAVAVSLGLNKHPVADVLAAAVAANNVNVCKVKPTQQNNGGGMHQSSSMGLSPPPQMQSGSMPSAPQPFFPAQYGVSAIPSPPAVLYNSPAVAAAAAMNSQGGLYNAFQIEPSGRSQFSQFPGHYGTSGTAGPYNAYMTTPTNMQAGPTPEMYQSLSSQFRMGSVQSPYNQTTQIGNPNTMLISSNNSSLMSSSVKSSTQQIGAIGQPKPNGGGTVNQPPYGQQYLNMFPPAPPLQNSGANYYSNSGGSQTAFFGTAGATGAATPNAYGIPAAAVAASNMFGSHGGQNPSNTPQAPPPQQQMPSYSSQFLNSPLLAASNPAMNQQQYRGAPNNNSQHSGTNAAAYIKSNQSPQSSHIQQQQQQQQQQQDTVSYYSFYHK